MRAEPLPGDSLSVLERELLHPIVVSVALDAVNSPKSKAYIQKESLIKKDIGTASNTLSVIIVYLRSIILKHIFREECLCLIVLETL